jgi:hypothetical protein
MTKFNNLMMTGPRGGLGMKEGLSGVLGVKGLHSAAGLGNKISEIGHLILDNPFADVALGVVAPELLIGGRAGLSLLDTTLSVVNPAARIIDVATKGSTKGINPMRG